jgi:hypothetical protein
MTTPCDTTTSDMARMYDKRPGSQLAGGPMVEASGPRWVT